MRARPAGRGESPASHGDGEAARRLHYGANRALSAPRERGPGIADLAISGIYDEGRNAAGSAYRLPFMGGLSPRDGRLAAGHRTKTSAAVFSADGKSYTVLAQLSMDKARNFVQHCAMLR